MNHLTRSDYAKALVVLGQLESACADLPTFVQAVMQALSDFVPCEWAAVSVCSLGKVQRALACLPDLRNEVRVPDAGPRGGGVDRSVAVPLFAGQRTVVSVVLTRRGADFGPRDRERLELLRPHLAFLYGRAARSRQGAAHSGQAQANAPMDAAGPQWPAGLTAREADVMRWLMAGKTDAEIGALLSISARTVQKHLEHVYIKLGVETRTAAVMRALGNGRAAAAVLPQTYNGTFGSVESTPIKSST
ncbi:helix-turn-helix transcriptional regulator [Variovorax dokdonensis]|uniref:Helix-turn-helix transcriptional regulator n=1 Tax=Variovorax dokdonensis TaxID=344883 RepID=A0ABT7NDA4_9BURK|nr:helix-turn-helix transcriptional regulator [Variovorax dokdonensis]MDM0045909.1 helix-turn-helix transcriptional regulator [Variovorax dokdonensis]